jgi:hypothetical protein
MIPVVLTLKVDQILLYSFIDISLVVAGGAMVEDMFVSISKF